MFAHKLRHRDARVLLGPDVGAGCTDSARTSARPDPGLHCSRRRHSRPSRTDGRRRCRFARSMGCRDGESRSRERRRSPPDGHSLPGYLGGGPPTRPRRWRPHLRGPAEAILFLQTSARTSRYPGQYAASASPSSAATKVGLDGAELPPAFAVLAKCRHAVRTTRCARRPNSSPQIARSGVTISISPCTARRKLASTARGIAGIGRAIEWAGHPELRP